MFGVLPVEQAAGRLEPADRVVRGDDRLMAILQSSNVTMKFRLSEKILTVAHKGRVVRKMKDKFALQFDPLSRDIVAMFQQVIDERAKPSYT